MKKCGIITYHAAYNFGSVLQAFAIQEWLNRNGYSATIINYRMAEQKRVYSIFRNEGIKGIIKDIMSICSFKDKIERKRKYEQFIESQLLLTNEFSEPEKMEEVCKNFDIVISGSDQIWNKHSNELHNVDWKYMEPYLLNNIQKKKISYASSIGNMDDEEEIKKLCNEIINFKHISMREKSGVERLRQFIPYEIDVVLDPTFLLSKDEWINSLHLKRRIEKKYVLFYSLASRKTLYKIKGLLNGFIKAGYDIHYITPYNYGIFMSSRSMRDCLWYGPKEFMEAIYNADIVLTDSYHGTILSINLEKEFYSINGMYASDYRKTEVLDSIGVMTRSIHWGTHISELDKNTINYSAVGEKIWELRNYSKKYLICSIES